MPSLYDLLVYPKFTYGEFLMGYPANVLGEDTTGLAEIATFNKPVLERYLKREFRVPVHYSDGKALPFDGPDMNKRYWMHMVVPAVRFVLAVAVGYALFGETGSKVAALPVILEHVYHRYSSELVARHLSVPSAIRTVQVVYDDVKLAKNKQSATQTREFPH
jgi:hypothetical protein